MDPSEVRRTILDDHVALRELLAELDQLARRLLAGEEELAPDVREVGERFRERFLRHLEKSCPD